MTFDDALQTLLDSDDWDAGFLQPTPEAIARAAELVPPTLDVRLSCLGVGDLRVHVSTPAYKRLTLVVPEDPEEPARMYWRRRSDDRSGMEDATPEAWHRRLAEGAPTREAECLREYAARHKAERDALAETELPMVDEEA